MKEPETDEFLDRFWEAWADWIKAQRGGTSQGKLARVVAEASGQGTRQEDVSRWLKGKGRPSYEELPALAHALGVRRDWLAFGDGAMVAGKTKPEPTQPIPVELEKTSARRKKNG